jgi:DNA-directed RNA polymerase specialized sigma24 family protein
VDRIAAALGIATGSVQAALSAARRAVAEAAGFDWLAGGACR